MLTRRLFTAAASTALAALMALPAGAADFVAKIGHLESNLQSRHVALERVAAAVAERTGGAVEFQIFPQGQLGQQREMTEGVQMGALEATVAPAAFLGGFNPVVSVMDIPFLLPEDEDKARELLDGPFGQQLCQSFDARGVTCLGLWPNGRKSLTSNKPLTAIEDFAGQRFRVMDSKILIEQFAALGASAVVIDFSELYTALQTGVVDGEENPLDTIQRMKYNEVQKHLVVSNHGAMEDVILFNTAWWDSLPEEYQTIIVEEFTNAVPDLIAHKAEAVQAALAALTEAGMEVRDLSEDERAALTARMAEPTRAAYLALAGDEGKALLDTYEAEIGKVAE